MKTKLISLASVLAILNAKAIEIGPTGSGVEMSGFIDIQSQKQDLPGNNDTETTGAQVELNFSYSIGPVSAAVGLDFGNIAAYGMDNQGPDNEGHNLEEAYITYDFGNGFSVTGGRMLTYMGFEAFDPINMYQFSYAYDHPLLGGQIIYDAYDYGASIDYGTDSFSIGVWSSLEANAGYELALAYTGIENFTAKAIWSDFSDPANSHYKKSTYWVSYQLDKLLLAAEVAENNQMNADEVDVDGMLVMANYAVSDKVGLTLRYSEIEASDSTIGTALYEGSKFTISPSYIFTDNLSGLLEYSSYDADLLTAGTYEPDELIAAEVIFTF